MAGAIWEKQSATALRVFGFPCSVFSESQEHGAGQARRPRFGGSGRANVGQLKADCIQIGGIFDGGAHRDPARLKACFENGSRCAVCSEG